MPSQPRPGATQAQTREATRITTLMQIRDSRTLKSYEKMFLYDLATHVDFEERAAREKARARMGLSDYMYRKARLAVIDRGLAVATLIPGKPTHYRLNHPALKSLYEKTKDPAVTHVDINKGVSRIQQATHVDLQPETLVEGHHRKGEQEREHENINKNRKDDAAAGRDVRNQPRSRVVVRNGKKRLLLSRSLERELEAIRREDDELDIFD